MGGNGRKPQRDNKRVQIIVADDVKLIGDVPIYIDGVYYGNTDHLGRYNTTIPLYVGSIQVSTHVEGYDPFVNNYTVPVDQTTILVHLEEKRIPTQPVKDTPLLLLDGNVLQTVKGNRIFLKGATDFRILEMLLEGQDNELDAVLDQREEFGCNLERILGMYYYINRYEFGGRAPFRPQTYGNRYYEGIEHLFKMLAARGMYGYFCAFADVYPGPDGLDNGLMGDENAQIDHHNRLVSVFNNIPNVLYELCNEPSAHDFNRVRTEHFNKPTGFLACSGSYDVNAASYSSGTLPPHSWDFGDLHPTRDSPTAHNKDCSPLDNVFFKLNKGLLIGEPMRYGSNSSNPEAKPIDAERAIRAASAGSMGIVFHTRNGVKSELWDGQTLPFARSFFIDGCKAL
jgi:hypothetical protein